MKKSLKLKLITLLALVASLFILAGCSLGYTVDEFTAQNKLVARISYYANGGAFNGVATNAEKPRELYFKEGQKALCVLDDEAKESDLSEKPNLNKPSIFSGSLTIARKDYILDNWYLVDLDEEGNPKYDEETGDLLVTDELFDFNVTVLQKGDHYHIAAKWTVVQKLDVYVSCEEGLEIPALDGQGKPELDEEGNPVVYKNGDYLRSYNYYYDAITRKMVAKPITNLPLLTAVETATFVEFYDVATGGTQENIVSWPVEMPENPEKDAEGNPINQKIYMTFLKDEWNIVKDAESATAIFSNPAKNHYVIKDIDCAGSNAAAKPVSTNRTFSGSVIGNGYTLSNMKVVSPGTSGQISTNFGDVSLFGEIGATAKIENITFKDLAVSYKTAISVQTQIHYFCTEIKEGATLNAVKIDGGSMTLDLARDTEITNLQGEGEGFLDRCYIFGGEGTDEAFLAKYAGVTVVTKPSLPVEGDIE